MRTRLLVISAMLIFAFSMMSAVIASAADPHVGVWKLNLAKSRSRTGSAMVRVEAQDNGVKLREDTVDAQGKASYAEFTGKFDGKDYPIIGSSDADMVSITKPDANTWDEVLKKAGKVVIRSQNAISKDGKTMTRTIKVKDEKRQEITIVNVYDKQIAAAADPFVGTWKMNPTKSKIDFKRYTLTLNGTKGVEEIVDVNGRAFQRSWTHKCDGKEYPIAAPDVDAQSCTQANANTIDYVCKKNGKVAWSGRTVISKDGNTQINNGGGKNEKGEAVTYTIFMEKQ